MSPESLAYSASLTKFLSDAPSDKPLSGFRIGVLKQGFELPTMDANVATANRAAIADLAQLGAEVTEHKRLRVQWKNLKCP